MTSELFIDLSAISHNARLLKPLTLAGNVCAVVKSNAYGLGLFPVAKALHEGGIDSFAVLDEDEATTVLGVIPHSNVLILNGCANPRAPSLSNILQHGIREGRVAYSISNADSVEALQALGNALGSNVRVHVEIDVGLSRDGLSIAELETILSPLRRSSSVQLDGVYGHLPCPHNPVATNAHVLAFTKATSTWRELASLRQHLASTVSAFRSPELGYDMIRVGLAWTGFGAEYARGTPVASATPASFIPAVQWMSEVRRVRWITAGTRVGYCGQWVAPRDTLLGLLHVGYYDGYPSTLDVSGVGEDAAYIGVSMEAAGSVQLADCPVVGSVSMNRIVVDLTDVMANGQVMANGDSQLEPSHYRRPATLLGKQPQYQHYLLRTAEHAGISPHELISRIGLHVPRRYVNTQGIP